MSLGFDDARFGRELPVWAARGILCAAPSAFWAVIAEFKHPAEITAMVLGTGLCIAGFAWFSAWEVMAATPGRRQFVRALKMSAWIKPATVIGLGGACALLSGMGLDAEPWFVGMAPDLGCGVGSLALVGWLAGARDLGVGRLDSFAWTALTTLVQGGLVSGLLVMLAAAVLVWWRVWTWLKPQLQFSPARIAG
jgi:hypothetical protein